MDRITTLTRRLERQFPEASTPAIRDYYHFLIEENFGDSALAETAAHFGVRLEEVQKAVANHPFEKTLESLETMLDRLEEASKADALRDWAKKDGPKNYSAYVNSVGSDNAVAQPYWYKYMKQLGVSTDSAAKRAAAGKAKPLPKAAAPHNRAAIDKAVGGLAKAVNKAPVSVEKPKSGVIRIGQDGPKRAATKQDYKDWVDWMERADMGEPDDFAMFNAFTRQYANPVTEKEFDVLAGKAPLGKPASSTKPKLDQVQDIVRSLGYSSKDPYGNPSVEEENWGGKKTIGVRIWMGRGSRLDHGGGPNGDDWRDGNRERKSANDKYMVKAQALVDALRKAGLDASRPYVDYDEKGHITMTTSVPA